MTYRTNATTAANTSSCEDTIWSISTWMVAKVNDDKLFELKDAKEAAVVEMARTLYDTFGTTDITLVSLLKCLDDPRAEADTKQRVHLSAMRSAMNSLIRAYVQFPGFPSESRIAAYRDRAEAEQVNRLVDAERAKAAGVSTDLHFSDRVVALA